MYLLTRPKPKAENSQQAFTHAGLSVTTVAPVDIQYLQSGVRQLQEILQGYPTPDCLIFTSTFACAACNNILHLPTLPQSIVAVGDSTARALHQLGVPAQVPDEHTSEGVLALSELNDAKNKTIVIIKGEGGRTTLLEQLKKGGANVIAVSVYRRVILKEPLETNHWQWPHVKGIIATSAEMARQLFAYYDNNALRQQRWVTVSERAAQILQDLGVTQTAVCHSASDKALIQWVKDNWE